MTALPISPCSLFLVLTIAVISGKCANYTWCSCDVWGTIDNIQVRAEHTCNSFEWYGDCADLKKEVALSFHNFTFGRCIRHRTLGPDAKVCCHDGDSHGSNCTAPASAHKNNAPTFMLVLLCVLFLRIGT
eukprot:m.36353 g.36353  ORF g.36353 m.36353 type:complete len:130 (+) comp9094_c0_seq1:202-591(+)